MVPRRVAGNVALRRAAAARGCHRDRRAEARRGHALAGSHERKNRASDAAIRAADADFSGAREQSCSCYAVVMGAAATPSP